MTSISLKNKIALVTGASKGIGKSIASVFAENGATLILTARNKDDLQKLSDELKERYNTESLSLAGSVTDNDFINNLYKTIFKTYGKLDILAANAGILSDGLLGMVSDDDLQNILDVNVKGVFNHVQSASRLMKRKKSGSIIITSSIIGRTGNKGQTAYAASKAATIGITKSAAKELGENGIRVNSIAPGFIETDMTKHLSKEIREERLNNIALRRTGNVDDVSDVVLFLASDLSRYVSGQIIGVDGCMVI